MKTGADSIGCEQAHFLRELWTIPWLALDIPEGKEALARDKQDEKSLGKRIIRTKSRY